MKKIFCRLGGLFISYCLALASASGATDQTLVLPVESATVAAEASSGVLNAVVREQNVYGASQFPPGRILIKELRFRPYVGVSPFSVTVSNIQFHLSTTAAQPDALSNVFAQNVGADDTIVFNGSLSISSACTGPVDGPKDFDIVVPLSTPFVYEPSKGNLLSDVRNYSGAPIGNLVDHGGVIGDRASRAFSFGADSTIADFLATGSDIMEIIYSPLDQTSCTPAPSGLVSWWQAESNAVDAVGGNDGVLLNGSGFGAGLVGTGAFKFDGGDDKINLGDPDSLKFTNSFTIEAWIFALGLPVIGPHSQIFFRGDMLGCLDPYYLSLEPNGAVRLHIEESSGPCGVDLDTLPVSINQWKHVAGVFDAVAGTMSVYVDGVLAAYTNTSAKPFRDLNPSFSPGVAIGNHSGGYNDQGFNGLIDELGVYSRALSGSEIQAIYTAGSAGKCAGTAGPFLLSIDFQGTSLSNSLKKGFAALGHTANDFWNYYTRDDGLGGWRTSGAVSNLVLVDGEATSIGLTVDNAPGAWSLGSTDPMYNEYMYPLDGGNVTIVVTNLPTGHYDVLPYGGDGNYEVSVVGTSYGIRTTYDYPVVNPPVWTEGVQYARFTNVAVTAGQSLVLTVRPGTGSYAVISGMQIARAGTNIPAVAPFIISQPTSQTVYVGNTAIFSVGAAGSPPLMYQWLFNGDPLTGKTNQALTLFNVQLTNAGIYSVIVSNFVDSVTSSNALLTVNLPPPCTPLPSGLISWWRFENDVLDNWNSNNGLTPVGFSFATGKVGKAFNFNQRYVLVSDSPSLRPTNGLTIEAWINPSSVSGLTPPRTIFAKANLPIVVGLPIPQLVNYSYYLGTTNNGRILFLVSPTGSASADGTIATIDMVPTNQWSLVVATYDGTALRIYLNGSLAAERPYSGGIFPGPSNVGIGAIPGSGTTFAWPFAGLIDEVSLYNRALSETEIQAIYNSDFIGKCLAAPTIVTQPLSQTIPQGEDVLFSVGVQGSRPLRYQWRFDGQNIFRATNSTFLLEKVQPTNSGFYTVLVSNSVGSVISSDGDLKVGAPLTCTPAPSGMISWWPADNTYADAVDANNATPLVPTVPAFSPVGKVNQAFNFNGLSTRIQVFNSPSLNFGSNADFSIEGWIKALPPAPRVYPYPNTPIVEKRTDLNGGYSLSLYQGRLAFWLGTNAINLISNSSMFVSPGPDLRDGMFHHVALSLTRGATNGGILCVDGKVVLTFDPTTRRGSLINGFAMFIGAPTTTFSNSYFFGQIDELTMYNRALSLGEIQAVVGAGSAGKCRVPAFIITQPTNQTVTAGSSAMFSVVAGGTPNLRYQWFKMMGNVPLILGGSTNSSVTLSNVQITAAGQYFVRVTNFWGSAISSNAVLTVVQVPGIPPANGTLQFELTAGQPHLQFTGVAGQQYFVEASTNLVDWTVIGTATDLGDGRFEFVDPDWTNYSTCFYRIVLP